MSSTLARDPTGFERRIHVVQGEFQVTRDPNVMLTTILGSCVAACVRDSESGIGGMNHFLLPEADTAEASTHLRYGVHSMELLINGILKLGARRDRLEVWLFGGARLFDRLTDVGSKNADFAEDFVRREELKPRVGSLRGDRARRIQFWPGTGRVRQLALAKAEAAEVDLSIRTRPPILPPPSDDVELF